MFLFFPLLELFQRGGKFTCLQMACRHQSVTNIFSQEDISGLRNQDFRYRLQEPTCVVKQNQNARTLVFFRGSVLEALLRGQVSGFLCVPLCHVLSVVRTEKLLWKSQQTMDLSSINSSYSGITLEKTSGI